MARLDLSSVGKVYEDGTRAVADLSIAVDDGEFLVLVGPSGCGKTTALRMVAGLETITEGEIRIGDRRVTRDNLESRKMIGLVPQSLALYDEIPAQENLEIFGSFYHIEKKVLKERIKERLEAVELFDRRKDKVQTFSGGMKRRLNLIASLLHDPPLLLCDEPTVGVDPQSRNAIFEYLMMLNRQGKTIVYTTHYMEEVERLCNRLAIIDFGKVIAEGTVDELLATLAHDESVFIIRNDATNKRMEIFKQFGAIVEEEDRFELKPHDGFRLSALFSVFETNGLSTTYIELRKPTLEALFLNLTGRRLRD